MNKSKKRAFEIIRHHNENIDKLNDIVKSIVLVGSLSDNSYTGNAGSDIDIIHILKDSASKESRDLVYQCIEKTEEETSRDIPISKCIYRYSDLFHPYKTDFEICVKNKDLIELPIEIFRMIDSGKIIFGDEIITDIPLPTRDDV